MKQNILYLLKGYLFSSLLLTVLVFFLAFLMQKTQWDNSIMSTLTTAAFGISGFLGGWYFAKHAPKRRFVWGLVYGATYFLLYLALVFGLTNPAELDTTQLGIYLAVALGAGCVGGMLS